MRNSKTKAALGETPVEMLSDEGSTPSISTIFLTQTEHVWVFLFSTVSGCKQVISIGLAILYKLVQTAYRPLCDMKIMRFCVRSIPVKVQKKPIMRKKYVLRCNSHPRLPKSCSHICHTGYRGCILNLFKSQIELRR